MENQSHTFEAQSAEEASQLVRAGWVLQSIQKRRDENGNEQLIYFVSRPRTYSAAQPVAPAGSAGTARKKARPSLLSLLNDLMS